MSQEFSGPRCYMHRNIGTIAHTQSAMDINESEKDEIVGLLIEMDYSYRYPSEERPTMDIWQGHTARKPPSINNQAADWGRLFDMMEDQKGSFMDKNVLQRSTPAYMVPGSQNAEWGRLFKRSDCWLRQITWTPVSDNGMGCREYETQWGRTHWIFEKDTLWGNPSSINGIEYVESMDLQTRQWLQCHK